MTAAGRIFGIIDKIELGQLFVTRKFLGLASRGAVDQALYLLVKSGEIIRVARGVFMKKGSPMPSAAQVARVKADAFGKRIFMHGSDAASKLGFPFQTNEQPTFACNGRSSSFRFGNLVIHLIGTSPRKLHGRDTLTGEVVRAMWQLGKHLCTESLVAQTYPIWGKVCPKLERAAPLLPDWMNRLFYWGRKGSRGKARVEPLPPLSIDLSALLPEYADLFRKLDSAM